MATGGKKEEYDFIPPDDDLNGDVNGE